MNWVWKNLQYDKDIAMKEYENVLFLSSKERLLQSLWEALPQFQYLSVTLLKSFYTSVVLTGKYKSVRQLYKVSLPLVAMELISNQPSNSAKDCYWDPTPPLDLQTIIMSIKHWEVSCHSLEVRLLCFNSQGQNFTYPARVSHGSSNLVLHLAVFVPQFQALIFYTSYISGWPEVFGCNSWRCIR